MKAWSVDYVIWRLETAYPGGFKYALKHPIQFLIDGWNFLIWCEKIDLELASRGKRKC
tara:strand:- start:1749 stop:1922 length:174 start_codon:yes stop_codon:yes gene_type:complete